MSQILLETEEGWQNPEAERDQKETTEKNGGDKKAETETSRKKIT